MPVAWSHTPASWHGPGAAHITDVPGTQAPAPSQISSPLQAFPSPQGAPLSFGVATQPEPGSQRSVTHGFWLSQTTAAPPVQTTGWVSSTSTVSEALKAAGLQDREYLRITMAFNGYGATKGAYQPDDLTPFIQHPLVKGSFHWVNHTFTHENLDAATARTTRDELNNNIKIAAKLDLPNFTRATLVTPDVSGLGNAVFLKAARKIGVRYVVSDTSRAGSANPSPNTGIMNPLEPGIYMIPRYPNSLFFNVASPADWAAEYNCIYRGFWGRDLDYSEILDVESDRFLTYLLKGDMNLWMFHQTNLDAYDGTHTLLTDLLDATIVKYNRITNRPILSPPMEAIGAAMQARAAYNASGVRATWNADGSVTIRVARKAVVPITGLDTANAEVYGDERISRVAVKPHAPVTLPR